MLLFSDQILAPCLYPCELLINLSAMRLQSLYVLKSKKDPILNEISKSKIDEYFE